LFQLIDGVQHLLVQTGHLGARLAQTAVLLGEAADADALVHAQRAHAGSAGFTPGKHGGGMEWAARHSAVATRVAAARLDLVDRAFDQFADLENLPQLAAILCRQVTKDLSLASGGIGNTHGRTHGFEPIKASRKANSVTMHFHGTRVFNRSPGKNAGGGNYFSNRAARC
jgi:hypothetical protein